jgi:hypothetical protein
VGLAYFYCDGKYVEMQDPRNILGSIVRQILLPLWLTAGSSKLKHLLSLRNRHLYGQNAGRVAFATIDWISKSFSRLYVIVDGLDECVNIEGLLNLALKFPVEASTVNVLMTSRPEIDIERSFVGKPQLGIEKFVQEDISRYIEWRLNNDG